MSKRLGLMHWRLRRPEGGDTLLRRAVAYDNTAEDRCIELYYLGLCFASRSSRLGAGLYRQALEAEGRDTVLRRRGDQRGPQLVKALRFNADACTRWKQGTLRRTNCVPRSIRLKRNHRSRAG